MKTVNFNLRGIPREAMLSLKKQAKNQEMSVNLLILKMIQMSIGYAQPIKMATYHELDALAGAWSAKEADEFSKNTEQFENIDKDIWQ